MKAKPEDPHGASPEDASIEPLRKQLVEAQDYVRQGRLATAQACLDSLERARMASLDRKGLMAEAASLQRAVDRRRKLRTTRIALLSLVIVTGLVLMVLLQTETSVAVEAEVRAEHVHFTPSGNVRMASISAESATLTGMDSVDTWGSLLTSSSEEMIAPASPSASSRILLQSAATPFSVRMHGRSPVLVDFVSFDAGSNVSFVASDYGPLRLRVGPVYGRFKGELQPGDTLEVDCVGCHRKGAQNANLNFVLQPHESVRFSALESGVMEIDAAPDSEAPVPLLNNFHVSSLSFQNQDVFPATSTVRGGQIRVLGMDGHDITLKAGDELSLAPADSFHVVTVDFGRDLAVRLRGRARHIRLNQASQLPSLLAWIHHSNSLLLYIAAFSSVVSFLWVFLSRLDIVHR